MKIGGKIPTDSKRLWLRPSLSSDFPHWPGENGLFLERGEAAGIFTKRQVPTQFFKGVCRLILSSYATNVILYHIWQGAKKIASNKSKFCEWNWLVLALAHTPLLSSAGAPSQRAALWCGWLLFCGDDWGNGRKEGFMHMECLRLTA